MEAFKRRQREDLERRQGLYRRKPVQERYAEQPDPQEDVSDPEGFDSGGSSDGGEEGWRSPEGDRLRDFGVDEMAEFYDEDDIPLAELIRRRKAEQPANE